MAKREAINRKLYAGNPYVRFDEGEDALAATSRRGPLLYKSIFSSCLRKTIILISFCFTSTVIFGDIIQSGAFSPIEFNMVFEGENSEKSVSAVAKSFYSYSKIGSTVSIRRINHSQAWGFVMEKGDAVDVEFNITSGGAYGLNVYCVPKNYNQLNSALPNENVWPTEIRKYTTGTNMGDTKSFKIEVSCISEYEGSKTYVVTKNGNERARFTVAGGQFFIVAFLDEGGATNHDYNLGYTIRVKKTSNPTATPTPFPPQMVFASQGDYPDKILVGWGSMSEGYDSPLYKVYRSESFSGTKILIGETSESTYEDTTAVYGKTYYYWIKGVNGDKESEYSTWEADGWLGEPNLWTVSFNANGGSGSMSSQTFSNGTSQALKANTFTRSGYEFIGWATSSSGSVVYSDQQSISLSANKTLYAVWKVIDGAFDLVFGNLVSKNWKQGFFLNNTSNDVSVMHSFLLGETIYRNFFFANTGNEILKDEFSVLHEVLNSDGTVRRSYTQFSNYEYAQNYGRYWANNPWESGLGNLPVGSYIYRCTIDSENVIPESNESNNVFEYSFSIIDASHEDSLLEALGIGKFAVTVGGDAEWFAQKDVTHDGVSAVQSGDISDNQTSWMEVVVKNVSSVSFWWKVSSESGWDKLHFYVDGTEVVEPISGESDWIKVEHALTTDSHTLKWVYTKDGSVSNGDDCGWVDSVVLMPVRGKVQLWAGGPYWATTNVGAENPEDYGYYFWWGDTVGYKRKNDCWVASNGSSYDFSFVSSNVPTYGKDTATLQSEGWITSDGVLAPEHDAANVHWGNGWRMPTYQELEDLKNNCDWTYTTVNGVNGFVVCGKGNYSANSIFLPCAGYSIGTSLDFAGWDGTIASSVPCSDISAEEDAYNRAWKLYFMGAGIDYYHMNKGSRDCGHSVRAVQNVTCLTVTFDTCGGSSVDSVSIPLGQTLGELPIPTRDGYIFLGWFTAAEGGEQVTESTVVTGNMTLYAQWGLVESLTVSESLVAADASGKSGLVSITANCGWTVSKNVSWIAVSPTSGSGNGMISYTIAANTTAQSRSGTITVTSSGGITRTIAVSQEGLPMYEVAFNSNGGTLSGGATRNIVSGAEIGTLPTPTRDGYIFLGWFTAADGGEQVTADTVVTGDMTLYAQWEVASTEPQWTIDENGVLTSVKLNGATEFVVPDNVQAIGERAFSGCSSLLSVTIPDSVTSIRDCAFEGCSSLISVTIPSSVKYDVGHALFYGCKSLKYLEVPPTLHTLLGFIGYDHYWFDEEVSDVDVRYYAIVTFDSVDVTQSKVFLNVCYGEFYEYLEGTVGTLPTPTRDGYTFLGWFTAAEGGTKISASTKVTDDVTYYAHWIAIPCTITFNANGGTVSPSTSTVTSGFAVGTLPTPTRSGYTFDGWYTSSSGGAKVSSSTIVTSNVTCYAHWIRNSSVPNPTPTPTPEPVPELGEGDYEVGGEMSDTSIPENAASVYDGYLYGGNEVAGTIQAKVARPKNGIAKVTTTIQITGEKKVSVKGELDVESGRLEAVAKNGRELYLEFGVDGMSGSFGVYEIDGARNFFSSKDKDEKSAAEEILEPYLGGYSMICDGGILSVNIAKKGKVTVKGTIDGNKVSAKSQVLIGEDILCIPVIYSKKSVNLAFTIWLPIDGSNAEVIGLGDNAIIGKAGTLKNGAKFIIDGDIGASIETEDERTLELLPDNETITVSKSKWLVADGIKAAKVAYKKGEFTITEGKKGAGIVNPSGLKLTYKSKDGSFSGSFTAYAIVKGKLKKHKATVEGILIGDVGYGTITIKKVGTWAVMIK